MFWHYNKYSYEPTPVYPLDGPLSNVLIKDESVNVTGTHKDRSLRHWVSVLASRGVKDAVISSSGSAARSAEYFCKLADINLTIFTLENSRTPKKDAIAFAQKYKVPNLRSSTDDVAIVGYKTIAEELRKQVPNAEELFVPVSSGAALLGIAQGYGKKMPRLYIVQTTKVHPMAEVFDSEFTVEKTHPSRAIIDRIAHRKNSVVAAIKRSSGGGYVISNKELEDAKKEFAPNLRREAGNESFLTLAALKKHRERNSQYADAKSVCVFTN